MPLTKYNPDRLGDQDPASMNQVSNDRTTIRVYIDTHGKKIKLQGDRIEHPDLTALRENNSENRDHMFCYYKSNEEIQLGTNLFINCGGLRMRVPSWWKRLLSHEKS